MLALDGVDLVADFVVWPVLMWALIGIGENVCLWKKMDEFCFLSLNVCPKVPFIAMPFYWVICLFDGFT